MPNSNYIAITGHAARDIEIKYTTTGKPVANLTVAVSEKFESGGEKKEETTWCSCEIWGGWAENLKGTLKGDVMQVIGTLKQKSYKDKGGNEKTSTYIRAREVYNHSLHERAKKEFKTPSRVTPPSPNPADEQDEVPF